MGSHSYWVERYRQGGNSGAGSYGELAQYKAELLNSFVATNGVRSVIEFGCGDGNQLKLAEYPLYFGFDISSVAVSRCKAIFGNTPNKSFKLVSQYKGETADMALSLDVIYHLVEDEVFSSYMFRLFSAAERYVVIYSSNFDEEPKVKAPHVRHRRFTSWINANAKDWSLIHHFPNPYRPDLNMMSVSSADFYLYERNNSKH